MSARSNNGSSIGPELGFGFVMGQLLDEPVLVLKSCIGNRGLGWDLLPPGSKRFVEDGKVYAGYREKPPVWDADPAKGVDTEAPPFVDRKGKPIEWHAGLQYDIDLADAKAALADLAKIYPDYKGQGYEIAGFVWWQGHKDQSEVYAKHYEKNLANLIKSLRKDYDARNAKFVLATGCGNPGRESFGLQIASDWNKSNGQFEVQAGDIPAFIAALPVGRLLGVGVRFEDSKADAQLEFFG